MTLKTVWSSASMFMMSWAPALAQQHMSSNCMHGAQGAPEISGSYLMAAAAVVTVLVLIARDKLMRRADTLADN